MHYSLIPANIPGIHVYTSQPEMAKPDWYQRGTIGYFDGTFAGLIDGWFD